MPASVRERLFRSKRVADSNTLDFLRTTRLPAIYVFGKKKIDPTQLVKSFKAVAGDILSFTTLRLKADVSFQHALCGFLF